MTEDWKYGGFGIYIHWPFCEAKCPYCDFNSHVSRKIDHSRWLRAYLSEIDRYAELLPDRILNSVFFGGGTPSLMDPDAVSSIIDRIRSRWPTSNDLEITLEANPSSVEADRFRAFAQAGVSRVSMGIQALNDEDLRRLGRIHSVSDAFRALEIARANFDRVSFDLIYARQHQTLDQWRSELSQALDLAAGHLSLYQLTIENGTAFGDRYNAGKLRGLPEEDLSADMYALTQDLCSAAGLNAYEVSNHAKYGSESRHNLIYWNYGDYIGIGPGAHGRITLGQDRFATEAWSMPAKWLDWVDKGQSEKPRTHLSAADRADEYLMMGIRLTDGIDLDRYASISGHKLPIAALSHLEEIGMINLKSNRLIATPNGRLVLNAIIKELLTS